MDFILQPLNLVTFFPLLGVLVLLFVMGFRNAVLVGLAEEFNAAPEESRKALHRHGTRYFRNNGDGTFSLQPDSPGIDGWSTGAVYFDADGDGDQDLYVAAYIDCTLEDVLEARPRLEWKGMHVMQGPFGLEGLENRYFENTGGGRFQDATEASGLVDKGRFYSFGVAAVDFDGDLDLDLYVANDSNPDYLYRNDGRGRFSEEGLWSGAALDRHGAAQAGMGVAVGDADGDGLADMFVTHFESDSSTLYRNLGDLAFADETEQRGLRAATFAPLSWGTVFADFDLDGDEDLFVANGHIYPQADQLASGAMRYAQANQLLENQRGRFHDVSSDAGSGLAVLGSSRGVAAGDIDNDGDVDLVVTNIDAAPTLLKNESRRLGSWLIVDAAAALRVEVDLGDTTLVRHRVFGASYQSTSDGRLHFGLGRQGTIERVRVVWPGGRQTVLEDVEADRLLSVQQPAPDDPDEGGRDPVGNVRRPLRISVRHGQRQGPRPVPPGRDLQAGHDEGEKRAFHRANEVACQIFREAYRVLRPGGRLAVSDIVTRVVLPPEITADLGSWAGCVAGAWLDKDYVEAVQAAGFMDVRIEAKELDEQVIAEVKGLTRGLPVTIIDYGRHESLRHRNPATGVHRDDDDRTRGVRHPV